MPSTNRHGLKRAILYARVSTDEQARSGYSLAQQIEALRDYAAREGHEVAEEVLDPGQSGASLERPGMDQVRDLVAAGGVSVVLAQDRDRFVREPAYLYLLKTEFAEYGTQLRAFNDRGDDSPEGEFFDGVLDQLAKLERAKLTERSRRGKFQKVRQGKLLAAAPRPRYGFRYNASRDGYEVDVETMPVVRRILRMFGEGPSIRGVRYALEREGVTAPSGGRRWSRTTVKNIVLDDCYRPHTIEELETLVTREVVARLEPGKLYGVSWWGRRRTSIKQVSENVPEGRRYRRSARR
jgi:site-specific DNA recombinase